MEVRRRTTLLDQMAILHSSSSNLRDLLRLRDEEDRRQEQTLTTLGSVLFGDKPDHLATAPPALRPILGCRNGGDRKSPISSTAAAAAVSRTLLDIMEEDEASFSAAAAAAEMEFTGVASSSNGGGSQSKITWKSFKGRFALRRPNGSVSAAGIADPHADQISNTSPVASEGPASAPSAAEENARTSASAAASEPVRMDLASALAAERRLRPGVIVDAPAAAAAAAAAPATPARMSLMTLLEETDRPAALEEGVEDEKKVGDGGAAGGDHICCVCMVRKKGAAFIPCGHTFCRGCSRELWVSRGDCPLCNAHILEVLDIF
ncbi:hypothetical protein ACLOJK_009686 [Asimina triloba]